MCIHGFHVHAQAPCHHPGDVRILSAVDRPELRPNPNPNPNSNPNPNPSPEPNPNPNQVRRISALGSRKTSSTTDLNASSNELSRENSDEFNGDIHAQPVRQNQSPNANPDLYPYPCPNPCPLYPCPCPCSNPNPNPNPTPKQVRKKRI